MKLGVVGLGLGYSLCEYLASKGHTVVGIDIDENAYRNPRLDEEMQEWMKTHHRIVFYSTDFSFLRDCEYVFVFVSTPLVDGRLSIKNVMSALESIGKTAFDGPCVILSTLPIGGMRKLHYLFPSVNLIYAPPMVKKHRFLSTFTDPPSRWQMFSKADPRLLLLYSNLQERRVKQLVRPEAVVEKAKLMTNLMLATKIIIANAIGDPQVCEVVSQDPRVGEGYFAPGGPASGPCLPRDLTELEANAEGPLKEIIGVLNRVNGTKELVS